MKMRERFGLLLLFVARKLTKLSLRLLKLDAQLETKNDPKTLIWDVIDGPFHISEFDQQWLDEAGIEDDFEFMMVVRMEEDGVVGPVNFWYKTEEEAIAVKNYFKRNIEPLEVQI